MEYRHYQGLQSDSESSRAMVEEVRRGVKADHAVRDTLRHFVSKIEVK